jgi:CRP/FNR family transcriptional regulator, cyclic AMP receptor protein
MPSLIPDVAAFERRLAGLPVAPAMFAGDPTVALYVAAILARRLEAANRSLIEVKHQLKAGEPPSVIGRTVEKVEGLLNYSGDASHVFGTPGYWGA